MTRTAETAVLNMRRSLIARILRLPMADHDVLRPGDLVSRLGADTTMVRAAFTGGLVEACGGAAVLAGAVVAMAVIDPVMLLVVSVTGVVSIAGVALASGQVQKQTRAVQESVGLLGANLERALVAIRTIRAAGAERQVEQEMDQDATRAYDGGVRIARVEAVLWPISGLAMQAAFLAVLGIGGARAAAGAISLGDLVSFVLFLLMLAMPLGQIFSAIVTVRAAMGALQRIHQVIDRPIECSDACSRDNQPAPAPAPRSAVGEVVFDDVSFAYESGVPVLTGVTFRVPAGSTTAIVGPSGAGKSTLLSLLEQFYALHAGTILVDGCDISTLGRGALRSKLGYVEQTAPVLSGTVRVNLTLGAPAASDAACNEVLAAVNLAERFERASGLDTVLGDRGVNLSGGERQRLAVARALLRDTPVLMLDEPTAAVDSLNEQLIANAVATAGRGRTVILVAHRLSTVRAADQLVVLSAGRVEARGTHAELMGTSGLYQDLVRRQLLS